MSVEEFKKEMSGLVDPLKKLDEFDIASLKDEAIRFVSILPEVFSDDLDRKTLWERIGNGLLVSISKSGGNIELFINCCLEYIKASPGSVASNEKITMFIVTVNSKPSDWREQFLKIIEKSYYLIIVEARVRWCANKRSII
jgi:hypothetical protein